ncbi:MAG: phosphoribosylamine--glycine ligase [Proteobacteria bacterium]|nr:phosphoribosylamine--glycine ligase [Pseudomonadota bacterium]
MNVLLLGSGARESALAWKFSLSPLLTHLYVYPGSVGLSLDSSSLGSSSLHRKPWSRLSLDEVDENAQRIELSSQQHLEKLAIWAQKAAIDLVVCGPEAPLCEGLSEIMAKHDIAVFGPSQGCARLESSKSFAKELMMQASIPTAPYRVFDQKEACEQGAVEMLARDGSCVIKADGLAAGKGVFICRSEGDILSATSRLYATMPQACKSLVVESLLEGRECSYFASVHQGRYEFMGFAKDYKCLLENNQGPNTGGMGCYSPVDWLAKDARSLVEARVVAPLLETLTNQGLDYTGFLYVGLMWNASGPQVLEFNIRMGDPECQALVMADKRDWLDVISSLLHGRRFVAGGSLKKDNTFYQHKTVCVVLASQCYPWAELEHDEQPLESSLLKPCEHTRVFTASMSQQQAGNTLITGRGRVLSVVSKGSSYKEARMRAYQRAEAIGAKVKGLQFRGDIALCEE